jgi:hypothetical protein
VKGTFSCVTKECCSFVRTDLNTVPGRTPEGGEDRPGEPTWPCTSTGTPGHRSAQIKSLRMAVCLSTIYVEVYRKIIADGAIIGYG